MNKLTKMISVFVVLILTFCVMPLRVMSSTYSDYITVTKNKSYTKDGKYYLSFTFNNVSDDATMKITAQLLDPSGGLVCRYNGFEFTSGKKQNWSFGYDYSTLPSGTYTLKVRASDWNYAYGEVQGWTWSFSVKHTAPTPSFSYKSYETYYNSAGNLMHKINIQCKNMKGERLYCKIYDADGYFVTGWVSDTPVRKTNNEVAYFAWSGYKDGYKYPSGDYTFIVTSSANKKVVEKTLTLKILEAASG